LMRTRANRIAAIPFRPAKGARRIKFMKANAHAG
jgi:hypothetical protein